MTPSLLLRCSGLPDTRLSVGGMIGRAPGSALCVDQPTISEAHAIVSLRGGRLVLLGLRGALEVDGERVAEVVLREGQDLRLGGSVTVHVLSVDLPRTVLAVQIGRDRTVLDSGTWSVLAGPRLVRGDVEGALGRLRPREGGWLWDQGGDVRAVGAGAQVDLAEGVLRFVDLPLSEASRPRTVGADAPVSLPLRIEVWRELSRITTADGRRLDLVGHPARILRELVLNGEPTHWEELAGTIWEGTEVHLRDSWRRQLQVLRRKLRAAGVRVDLVQSLGDGRAMLDLRSGDVLEDRTFDAREGPGGRV
ncbi:hypothetical protein L6R53_02365 [Myxococcota bacterium]|nr:hypothetical protein [Myxococcota bacterium]